MKHQGFLSAGGIKPAKFERYQNISLWVANTNFLLIDYIFYAINKCSSKIIKSLEIYL